VRKNGSIKQTRPRFDFRCIYYKDDTLDTRRLEIYIKRDEENRITSVNKKRLILTLAVALILSILYISRLISVDLVSIILF
jgi:hypothetical protein